MKRLFLLLLPAVFLFADVSQAQVGIKFSPLGVLLNTRPGGNVYDVYAINIEAEHLFSQYLSATYGIGLGFPGTGGGVDLFIRPEINYYLSGAAPTGLYVGGFFGYGYITRFGFTINHLAIGGQGGYQFTFAGQQFALDLNLQLGYGGFYFGGGGGATHGFWAYPRATVGWFL